MRNRFIYEASACLASAGFIVGAAIFGLTGTSISLLAALLIGLLIIFICTFMIILISGLFMLLTASAMFVLHIMLSFVERILTGAYTVVVLRDRSKPIWHQIASMICSEQELENIVGDLHEEFIEVFESRSKREAYVWLARQISVSFIPLAYKSIRQVIADKLRAKIR